MKTIIVIVFIVISGFLLVYPHIKANNPPQTQLSACGSEEATCYGHASCNACKTCEYCKYCSKDKNSCGVCD